eukprot:5635875-Amphidinium_carterae.1
MESSFGVDSCSHRPQTRCVRTQTLIARAAARWLPQKTRLAVGQIHFSEFSHNLPRERVVLSCPHVYSCDKVASSVRASQLPPTASNDQFSARSSVPEDVEPLIRSASSYAPAESPRVEEMEMEPPPTEQIESGSQGLDRSMYASTTTYSKE